MMWDNYVDNYGLANRTTGDNMALISTVCNDCGESYHWFSGHGHSAHIGCKGKVTITQNEPIKEKDMKSEQGHLEALTKLVSVQRELIDMLKAEVERLKASQLNLPTPGYTGPGAPFIPYINPQPIIQTHPNPNPLLPPYIITSGGASGTITTGRAQDPVTFTGPLPLGSQQYSMGSVNGTSHSAETIKLHDHIARHTV